MPPIYNGVVLSVADVPGREVTQNARLFAAVAQAADDALLAVFDAKYHYNFWRPVTAIRNGDLDGNDATERDASWTPFIDTPMHPEYPCAHCIVAGAVGTVLQAEIGTGSMPTLTTTSYLAKGPARQLDEDRRLHAGGGERARLRRRALPQLDRSRHGDGQAGRRARRREVSAPAGVTE